jgi:hypothetical protein
MAVFDAVGLKKGAEMVGERPSTLKQWIREDKLPAIRINGKFFIDSEILSEMYGVAYADKMPVEPLDDVPTQSEYKVRMSPYIGKIKL